MIDPIRSLYETRLLTWAAARVPPLPVAVENVEFTPPPANGTYLRAFLLRGDTTSRDLAGDNRNRVGTFQVNIITAAGDGPGAAEGIAAELEALFPMLRLESGVFWVQQVTPVRIRPGIPDGGTFTVATDFDYRSDTYPV